MPAPPFPPCCGPSLNIPICLPRRGCSLPHPQPSLSHHHQSPPGCLSVTPLSDPPQEPGIAPCTSEKHMCTWSTVSLCFKWTNPLKAHPTPPQGSRAGKLCPLPWPLLPWDMSHPCRDTSTLFTVPPSSGQLSVPRTSALVPSKAALESAAWPHPSSACSVCPRLDPGEAPKGGIWKEAKTLSTKVPKPSPCSINQPWQHQHTQTYLQTQPAACLALVPEPMLPPIRVPSHGMAGGVRNSRDLQCPALEPGFGGCELPSAAFPSRRTGTLARSHR